MHLTQRSPAQRPRASQSRRALQHAVEEKAACVLQNILEAVFHREEMDEEATRMGVDRRPNGGAHGPEVHCGVVEGRALLLCLGESGSAPGRVRLSRCLWERASGGGLGGRAGAGAGAWLRAWGSEWGRGKEWGGAAGANPESPPGEVCFLS
jgi:hypothetical protein